ncbi:MAG: hypothetical protein HQK50_12260 [Oligoflexia bacterium]|nr:hypothetical protein [Oligoflexia bacterium]MBF0366339.1 hypothetical protein [Oligoflexia bacterium]
METIKKIFITIGDCFCLCCCCCCLFFSCFKTAFAISDVNLYSESSFKQRSNNAVNATKLTALQAVWKERLHLYLQLGLEEDTKSNHTEVYNYNHAFAGVGGRFFLLPQLFLFGEIRGNQQLLPKERAAAYRKLEQRMGAIFYSYDELFQDKTNLFAENYGELISSNQLRKHSNLYGTIKSKLGNRFTLPDSWREFLSAHSMGIDAFALGELKRDRRGYYEENVQEIGLGIRPQLRWNHWSIAFDVSKVWGAYAGVERENKNPYGSKSKYDDFRLLFTLYADQLQGGL